MPELTIEDLFAALPVDNDTILSEMSSVAHKAINPGHGLIPFLYSYAAWNSEFGSGVAGLAAKIGRSRHLFTDPDEEIPACADRSVYVASFIFAAARDEFDDSDTAHLDTHRCLAQAFLKGVYRYTQVQQSAMLGQPHQDLWLSALIDRVAVGYGNGSPDNHAGIFRALGFHLGSEVLADKEFSVLDRLLRRHHPEMVKYLENTEVRIGAGVHNCYHWIRIHSGDGGGVEADHFKFALDGARMALQYIDPNLRDECHHQMLLGFQDFYRDHSEFFRMVR